MEAVTVTSALPGLQAVPYAGPAAVGGIFLSMYVMKKLAANQKATRVKLPPVPEVPGLPLVGNLLQLKERKPHKTFMGWAETHGPIYSIKTGSSDIIVVNSADLAREAMITRFASISTRKMPAALKIFTQNKCMVATSDYDEFHKMVKKYLLANLAGASALRRHRSERDDMVETVSSRFQTHAKTNPDKPVNFREIYESELFSVSMKEAMGVDVQSIYVPELGATLSRDDLLHILVLDPMEGATDVDWRDFFPFLGWVPNRSWEQRIQRMHFRRQAVMNALITEQKKRIARGETLDCHLDLLLAENTLTEKQISMLLWEVIIETADTTMVAVEWAIYELAKNQKYQAMLYQEIKRVCGSEKITEDNLREMPFLNAVFNETIRKYSPAPVIPLRYVHEDTEIGGYHIPAGTEIALNIYGCNMDKNQWENPEEWNPERFLNGDFDQRDLQKTMAFGAGKRSCAGALQATLLGSVSIGRLVQEFEWQLRDGEEENVDIVGLTTRKLQPLYVNIKPRAV